MVKRRLFRHVQIQPPDGLRTLCGLLQALEGIVRLITLGVISAWFSSRVSLAILRRDVNRSRAKRGLPPYKPFQRRDLITEEPVDELSEEEVLNRGYF